MNRTWERQFAMPGSAEYGDVDEILLKEFRREIKEKVPHWEEGGSGRRVVGATPLIEITDTLIECAKVEYGLDISKKAVQVLGKFDSTIFGGSVKIRPAVQIIENAISSGLLGRSQPIFEATSGNFGIALGLLGRLGVNVVALVSRKLQEGVFQELRDSGVKTVDLDVEICPAPGLKVDPDLLLAKAVASNLRGNLQQLGFDPVILDSHITEIANLLGREDVINLAKFLAKIYNGYCPEQYDNYANIEAHEKLTGPEIDQQVHELGHSLGDFRIVTTFGTGGTSGGLSRYAQTKYGEKSVHVVFPLDNQDVAGIRTKRNASGLSFYEPSLYAGEHEVDFEASKRLLRFFVAKGYDLGESSALALFVVLQMLNYGVGRKFIVIIADGIQKYKKSVEIRAEKERSFEVTPQEVSSKRSEYASVIWTHNVFLPREEGIKLIASSLGFDEKKIRIVDRKEVEGLLASHRIPELIREFSKRKVLLVCMAGGVSLRVAKLIGEIGVEAESLKGGITGLSASTGKKPVELVRVG